MKTINTVNAAVIARAAAEAGIRADESCRVYLIDCSEELTCFELETEWTVTVCYADTETGELLGIMTEAKSIEDLLSETRTLLTARNTFDPASGKAA